jgi:hypothetical protein
LTARFLRFQALPEPARLPSLVFNEIAHRDIEPVAADYRTSLLIGPAPNDA